MRTSSQSLGSVAHSLEAHCVECGAALQARAVTSGGIVPFAVAGRARPAAEWRAAAPDWEDADFPPGRYPRKLIARSAGRIVVVDLESVRWIEAAGNYLRLHTGNAKHTTRMKISDVEKRLDPREFVRVHRGSIVNLRYVVEFRPISSRVYQVTLDNGTEIRMSNRYTRQILSSRFLCGA